ncbi:hypothetical protein [Paraburkholderia bannensis]|uniref:hypothetical protein n=1 Tax=Paraburkholderia bannensis TaxID=765414 RepID=UPI0006947C38|nr:hypothetical protein [Paraburkholderia bannensis]
MRVLSGLGRWLCGIALAAGVALAWLAASLLCWPLLIALQRLGAWLFIAHARGSYRSLDTIANATLMDFPRTWQGALSVPFIDAPLGFFILFWALGCAVVGSNAIDDWRKAHARKRRKPVRTPREIVWRTVRQGLIVTAVFCVICAPFLRRYEIVTQDALYTRGVFDWREHAYALDTLTRITVDAQGRGPVLWRFEFAPGESFTTTGPDRSVLEALLARPHVGSNVRVDATGLHLVR